MASRTAVAPARIAPFSPARNALRIAVTGLAIAAGSMFAASAADARIVRIEITEAESPTFGGHTFAGVGQYEKLVGVAHGEIDPADPRNAVIVDLPLAPKNAAGKVEYSHTF